MKKVIVSIIGAVLWTAGASGAVLFTDDFESRNTGSIDGQGGWFVTPTATTNQAVVVSNPGIAYQGSQYLSMVGGVGAPVAQIANLNAPISEGTNDLFSYSIRFEDNSGWGNGLQTWWDADNGPPKIVHSFFSATGGIWYWTNSDASFINTGVSINTGTWYNVSYRAYPSSGTVGFMVSVASNNASVFDQIIPMNTSVSVSTNYGFHFQVDNSTLNHWLIDNVSISSTIPEPSLSLLLGVGGMVVGALRRRRIRG